MGSCLLLVRSSVNQKMTKMACANQFRNALMHAMGAEELKAFHLQEKQVLVEARHCNPLLQFHVREGDARGAEQTLQYMRTGAASANAASFELLAEVVPCL